MVIEAAFWILVLVVSLYVLVRAADFFVKYSERLGKTLRMSPFVVGVVIVSIGTALPEFSTSLVSVAMGNGELIFGTMIGSVIANILLVLGIASVLMKKEFLKANWDFTLGDFPALIFTMFLVFLTLYDGELVWQESLLFILASIVFFRFLYFVYNKSKETLKVEKDKLSWKTPVMLGLSLVIVLVAAKFSIDSIIKISEMFGVLKSALAASVIAIGTSLPELSTVIAAVRQKNYDLAFGNAIGASIVGMLIVFGLSGLFGSIAVPPIILLLVLPMLLISGIVFWVTMQDKQITHYEGWLMIILYVLFILKLFSVF